jgi:glycosyltransferase involved in cell wall biosynthesis
MHVMVVPSDRGGCGHYRLIWPAQAVGAARPGWTVSVVPPERVMAGFRGGRLVGVRGLPDPPPDVLVMQRVGTAAQLAILRHARGLGAATVVDFDDAMWCIDRDNYAFKAWNSSNPRGQHWRVCEEAAATADLVTVTTDALAKRYGRRHHRVEVVPNRVPWRATEVAGPDRGGEPFTAGWAGFTRTHPGDCKVSAPAARAVLDGGGWLRVVADAAGAAREWDVNETLVEAVPARPLGPRYFGALTGLDLMLVGLRDTPFNRAKSTLKVLEAGAAGVPSVAPDNPPHRALARSGFPVALASTPSEWADAAKRVKDEWERDGGERARNEVWAAVQAGHTIEGNAESWAQAWERAARLRS